MLDDWRAVRDGHLQRVRRRALENLDRLPPERLAIFGLENGDYARDWLNAENMAVGMAFSLLLLDRIEPITSPGAALWHAMHHSEERLDLPSGLLRLIAAGYPLVHWFDKLAGTGRSEMAPPDSHLGGWTPARTVRRLQPMLHEPGTDPEHDTIRKVLAELNEDDWLVVSTIW